jgi:S1-C subfamily serine protease
VITSIVSRRRSRRCGKGALKKVLAVILAAAERSAFASAARAQSLDEIFTRVSPSVVVVRSKGRDVSAEGVTRFNETGSGVLISSDGRVMTAAHVVNGMDEITVEGIGGEVVRATIVSANAAADVSLLQLERVTKAMRVVGGAPEGERHRVRGREMPPLTGPAASGPGCPAGNPRRD